MLKFIDDGSHTENKAQRPNVEASIARYRQFYSKFFLGEMNEPEQEIHGTKLTRVLPIVPS